MSEHGSGERVWEVGGKRVIRCEDYLRRLEKERAGEADRLAELARRSLEAQREYSEAMRAVSPADRASHAPAVMPVYRRPEPERVVDELTDHNYDGIQEYDNPTPGWWYWIFYATIAYSVMHVAVVHFTPESVWRTPRQAHAVAEARALERQFAELSQFPMGEEKILRIMGEPRWLEQGESIFRGSCALCHGQRGEGLVGPNLTDEYYKPGNVSSLIDLANIVVTGAGNGAMPSQQNVLNENEIALVAAYVASLRGRNLEGPRGPEGEPIAPWPTLDEDGRVVPPEDVSRADGAPGDRAVVMAGG